MQATDISQNSLVPAFELNYNTAEWVAPFDDAFAEPENPVPYAGAPAAGGADFTGGFGDGLANGHAEVRIRKQTESRIYVGRLIVFSKPCQEAFLHKCNAKQSKRYV